MKKKVSWWIWVIAGILMLGALTSFMMVWTGLPVFKTAQEKARIEMAAEQLIQIQHSFRSHYHEFSFYPTGSGKDVFDALDGRNPRGMVYLNIKRSPGGLPLDPWGREYVFSPGASVTPPTLYSVGPDGIDQGGAKGSDDIR